MYAFSTTNIVSCVLTLISLSHLIAPSKGENATCETPPPFHLQDATPTIYFVMNLVTGDYFDNLISGAQKQAPLISSGVDLQILSSDGDDVKQAEMILEAAQDPSTVGILTVDGSNATLCDAINSVLDANITVVSFDFGGDSCSEKQVLTKQQDADIASLVLEEALTNGPGQNVNVGYVSDLNYQPLINRNAVWEEYKASNNWNQVFFVENAANYSSSEDLQNAINEAIKDAQDNVTFIYAPWDYLSVNTVSAIQSLNQTILVYGADINNNDITVMTEEESPWKATAGGDPRYIGASLIRMVATSAANQLEDTFVTIPSFLITQEFLLANQVTNLNELDDTMPEIKLPEIASECWITNVDFSEAVDNTRAPTAVPITTTTTPTVQNAEPSSEMPTTTSHANTILPFTMFSIGLNIIILYSI